MTEWLYLTDSYLRTFSAEVIRQDESGVVLDRSAFYPRGGGQPSDEGYLETPDGTQVRVSDLNREAGEIVHVLEEGPMPAVGATVQGAIDWPRRYLLMRIHTAMHMLSGVIFRDFGASVTGSNMEPGRGRLDFELEGLQREMVDGIEAKLNAEVEAARDVEVTILAREEAFAIDDLIRTKVNLIPDHVREIRIVNIQGLDMQADGGTHVANTREVGEVRIVGYKSKGKINKRLQIALSDSL
jgi:misacylated tRNA(Ala) deacylase